MTRHLPMEQNSPETRLLTKLAFAEFGKYESQCCSLFYCLNPAGKASRLCEQKQNKSTEFYTGQYNDHND